MQLISLLQEQLRVLQAQHIAKLQTPPALSSEPILYLKCRYAPKNGIGEITSLRGTGVIINPQGQILTARHLIDPAWAAQSYPNDPNTTLYRALGEQYTPQGCEVSFAKSKLPTPQEIKTINPRIPAGTPQYEASLTFTPPRGTMSDEEYGNMDFALLQIIRPFECPSCALPGTFPYMPLHATPEIGTPELLSYGYPIEGPPQETPFLKGVTGNLVKYFAGNSYFKNSPFLFEWSANDAREGRSGSPIFAAGKLIGIEIGATADNVTQNYALSIPAIHTILVSHGATTSTAK